MSKSSRPRSRAVPADRIRPALEALEDRCVPNNSATFRGLDLTTQGSWQGTYGGSGYSVVNDAESLPGNTKVTVNGASTYVYPPTTNSPVHDLRGLQTVADPTTRTQAGWFNYVFGQTTTSFTVEIKVPSALATIRVAFYIEDWDGAGRAETVTAVDGQTGAPFPLANSGVVSNYRNGAYLLYDQQGDVIYTFTKNAGPSAELSAMFFGAASAAPAAGGSAAFVKSDSTTNGAWNGTYGTQGYNVFGATPSIPPTLATLSTYGASFGTYTFAASTSDPRGLQNPSNLNGPRIAVAQYSTDSFTLDVNITDGAAHQVTLYAVDWDNVGRIEKFEVIDNTTGQMYDTRTLGGSSGLNFSTQGVYLSWNVSRHVQIRVTRDPSTNQTAVVQGVFFDPDPPVMGAAAIAPLPASTAVTTVAPQASTSNAAPFLPPGLPNGVDVVLLDRLFANGRHLYDADFGDLTDGMD